MIVSQFKDLIVVPTLKYLDPEIPFSDAAVNLLLLTWATESQGGKYIKQLGGGPALSVFQMERDTHDDHWKNWLRYKPDLWTKVDKLTLRHQFLLDRFDELAGNLYYATAMARVHYYRSSYKLPDADDEIGLAMMWKGVYNTHLGAGVPSKAINDYRKYVTG
jgi:hypothetical protein